MKNKKRIFFIIIFFTLFCLIAPLIYYAGRPLPIPHKKTLYDGVIYERRVKLFPRMMIIHVLRIDLTNKDLKFLVTPGDPKEALPLKARTTSKFLDEFNVQIAINGGGFSPWWSNTPVDYFPHGGDAVQPAGFSASRGNVYYREITTPVLMISKNNQVTIGKPAGNIYNAISSERLLIEAGNLLADLPDDLVAPRTALGIDKQGKKMIIIVIDGRQPFYSDGATILETAQLLLDYGVYDGINFDGGGSSTLVMRDANGRAVILNSPIDLYIPGRERAVGNHFGIIASEK